MKHCLRLSILLLSLLLALAWSIAPQRAAVQELSSGQAEHERIYADAAHTLRVSIAGETVEMDMAEYLTGVLRAEMPASFEMEALKAQAVAARTYTLYKMRLGESAAHPDADTCDDINCCKAYKSAAEAAEEWGSMAVYFEQKLVRAVAETDAQVLLYDGEPVLAVFFSSAAGQTQGAEEVWLTALPYLKSVSSPETEDLVPNYYSTVRFSCEEFCARIRAAYPSAEFAPGAEQCITSLTRNDSGFVSSVSVGGLTLRGNELRTLLQLRSPCFTVEVEDDALVFHVTGYGHGVGMSQYGANAMAKDGADYREILLHYYSGTTLGTWTEDA